MKPAIDGKPYTVPKKVFNRILRASLFVISVPLTIIVSFIIYLIIDKFAAPRGWVPKEDTISLVVLVFFGVVSGRILLQCLYIGITGMLPLRTSKYAANEFERFNKASVKFLIFSILYSVVFIGCIMAAWFVLSVY